MDQTAIVQVSSLLCQRVENDFTTEIFSLTLKQVNVICHIAFLSDKSQL